MTTPQDRAALADTVARLTSELESAEGDVALLQRLKAAEAEAKRLTAELATAKAALAEADVAAEQAARSAIYAPFEGITVEERGDGHILHKQFFIHVNRKEFDGYEDTPQTRTYQGFQALSADAFSYLIERQPEQIPGSIMALSPGDPWDAFDQYITAKRRGFLSAPANAAHP
jgi:hypothetical protein